MARRALRWRNGSPTRRLNNKLKRLEKALNSELFSAVKTSTDVVRSTVVLNAVPSKPNPPNQQVVGATDSHTGRYIRGKGNARRIVTRKVIRSENVGQVRVKPYYTGARTRAIKSLYTKYGKRAELTRPGLKVKRPWLKQRRAKLVRFDEDKKLKRWAIQRKMIARQRVRLTDGRIVRDLLLRPGLKRNEPFMRRIFKSAFIRAGARIKK